MQLILSDGSIAYGEDKNFQAGKQCDIWSRKN
jgi:hypothetical protein